MLIFINQKVPSKRITCIDVGCSIPRNWNIRIGTLATYSPSQGKVIVQESLIYASLTGKVADIDLAIASGRGPDVLTNIDNLKSLVRDEDIILRDEDIILFGYRDREQAASFGSQDVTNTNIHSFDLPYIKQLGIRAAASEAVKSLLNDELCGFWIHLDVDGLDDAIMPAVDYRLKGGLSFDELSELLKIIVATGHSIGIDITIFNPNLDSDGSIARRFVSALVKGILS